MKKILCIFLGILLFSMVQISPAAAWNVMTHYEIMEQMYYSFPIPIQQKLNLGELEDGAAAPDLIFRDYSYHYYPSSFGKVDYWLNKGKYCYAKGDYKDASYCFGVASHYISDSVCAPHCAKSSLYYHNYYEISAIFLNPHVITLTSSGNLDSILTNDKREGKELYNKWMKNKDGNYMQKNLDQAVTDSYSAINNCLTD
jgi:Zinc dependent phospholipase C